jgi:hypothetical protein
MDYKSEALKRQWNYRRKPPEQMQKNIIKGGNEGKDKEERGRR